MIDKTEAQPEALRVAAWLINAPFKTTHGDMLIGGRELRRQHAEVERLRGLAATCYAGLGGECDLPLIWLDALNNAANGEPFEADSLLPFASPMRAELIQQTNRAASAEQQVTALNRRLDDANAMGNEARYKLAQLSQAQAVPDGWRLVPEFPTLNMFNTAFGICTENGRPVQQMIEAAAEKYAAMLAASPTPPARKGVSDEEIKSIYYSVIGAEARHHPVTVVLFARAIEAAHGIGASNDSAT